MERCKLYVFGFPRLEREGQPEPVNRRKMLALLGYLLVSGQAHSREALATLFWPDFDASKSLANLRRDLSRLKSILGDGLLGIEHDKVWVRPAAGLWSDVGEFEALVQQAEQHGHFHAPARAAHEEPPQYCRQCQAVLEQAAGLYTDDFMAGFNLPDSPAFDEWQFFQVERLRGLLAEILQQLARWETEQGNYERAIEPARRWLALDPLHEPACRALMQLYAWAGQPAAALRQYNILAKLLDQELGALPEAATTELHEAIRARRLTPPGERAAPVAALVAAPQALPPGPAERFSVEALISTGGFGEIYRGRDRLTGATVAIKRLLPHLVASSPEMVKRFVREGEALGQLNHPNIIPMLAFYEHDNTYNLVMEYLPDGSLRNLLDRQRALPAGRTLEIALELADALSRAHHLHILHRDLKPENILLDAGGHPRLIDFGLAMLQGTGEPALTQAGMLLGSPAYMSPEAIRGDEMDPRSDIWSFGVLLFEMLTGTLPFAGEKIHSLIFQILNAETPSLRQLCPDVPPALESLVGRMLEKDREKRIPSMRQAAAYLEAIRDAKITALDALELAAPGVPVTSTPQTYLVDLPAQPTPFIGRENELSHLDDLLNSPGVRMITLVGAGGIGKTRLAVETAARRMKQMANGAVFVPLAAINDAEFLIPAIASALRFRFTPGVDPKEQLAAHLSKLKMLLVLDNFEHLLSSAGLVSDLLAAAHGVQVLVTSRERLNLLEEWVYEVSGLPYPPAGEPVQMETPAGLEQYGAVQLFIERARRANPSIQLDESTLTAVLHICRLVEGMPLALELAAPWARVMSCVEIAQELEHSLDLLTTSMRNLPDRHRSLRVVFDQSWQSLLPPEQEALVRLAVFQSGCTREAAEKIAGARPAVLMALVDKALLRHRGSRYDMHELIRQYLTERLTQDARLHEETLDRHYRYYLEVLGAEDPRLKGGRQIESAQAISIEIDNIRAAWQRAVQRGDRAMLLQAAEPYWLMNEFRGTLRQGEAAFRQAGDALSSQADDRMLLGFLRAAQGSLLARQWNFEQGRALMEQGLALLRQADPRDPEKTAFALTWFAFLNVMRGQFSAAELAAQESLAYFPITGDRWTQAGALRLLGAAALYQGQLQRAQEYLEECVAVCKSIGELRIRSYATANLGVIHLWMGQIDQSRQYFEDSVRMSISCNDRLSRADALCEYLRFLIEVGEYEQAVEMAQKSILIYQELGRPRASLANIMLGNTLRLMGKEGAQAALEEGLASARAVDHRPDIASGLEGLGNLALDRKEYDLAQRYYNEALEIWMDIGHEPEIAIVLCRSALGLIVAGAQDPALIHDKLIQALRLGSKHQAGMIAITAMVGLASMRLRAGDASLAVPTIFMARRHPATPSEVRSLIEALIARRPELERLEEVSGKMPRHDMPWQSLAETWESMDL